MDEGQLLSLLNNKNIVNTINSGEIDATLQVLLEGVVNKQVKDKTVLTEAKKALTKSLTQVEPTLSPKVFEEKLVEFNSDAMKAYTAIASSAVSIAEGEMSAMSVTVPTGIDFGKEANKVVVSAEKDAQLKTYVARIEDTVQALEFLIKEMVIYSDSLKEKANEFGKLLEDNPALSSVEIVNLVNATTEYIKILGDSELIQDSINKFKSAKSILENLKASDGHDWAVSIIKAIGSYACYMAKVAESEEDLNKINDINAAGPARRGMNRVFGEMIRLDQKQYPNNNQIEVPSLTKPPALVSEYVRVYKERASQILTADANAINRINNEFNRKIANLDREKEGTYTGSLLIPMANTTAPTIETQVPPPPTQTIIGPSPEEVERALEIIDSSPTSP